MQKKAYYIRCKHIVYMDKTGHINYFNGEIRVENGKRKWVRIINIYTQLVFIHVSIKLKKEARQVNRKFFKFKKGEYRDRQHA